MHVFIGTPFDSMSCTLGYDDNLAIHLHTGNLWTKCVQSVSSRRYTYDAVRLRLYFLSFSLPKSISYLNDVYKCESVYLYRKMLWMETNSTCSAVGWYAMCMCVSVPALIQRQQTDPPIYNCMKHLYIKCSLSTKTCTTHINYVSVEYKYAL